MDEPPGKERWKGRKGRDGIGEEWGRTVEEEEWGGKGE